MATRIDWLGDQVKGRVADEGSAAVRDSLEFLLEESNRTVPIEEGNLARSGAVDIDGLAGTISYDTPYARRLHENPQYRFQHSRRGKWLQLTVSEQARLVERWLRERMAGAFR